MEDERPLKPMISLREVLREIDRHIDKERLTGDVCPDCMDTGTATERDDRGVVIRAWACKH